MPWVVASSHNQWLQGPEQVPLSWQGFLKPLTIWAVGGGVPGAGKTPGPSKPLPLAAPAQDGIGLVSLAVSSPRAPWWGRLMERQLALPSSDDFPVFTRSSPCCWCSKNLRAGPWLSSHPSEAVPVWAGKGLFSLPDHLGTGHRACPARTLHPGLVVGQWAELGKGSQREATGQLEALHLLLGLGWKFVPLPSSCPFSALILNFDRIRHVLK